MLKIIQKRIERILYKWGFQVPEVRAMAVNQVGITVISLCVLPLGRLGVDCVAGVALGSLNFLALARVIQELVFFRKGAVLVQLACFYGRLLFTAFVLYVLIVYLSASGPALLVGFSTVLINILLWGMSHFLGKTSKEA